MTMDPRPVRAGARTFAGLFLVTLSTLTYQLLLTRTFSVTMYYHFAFVAISVTMFGMAVGALAVFLRPTLFVPERVSRHLAIASAAFAVAIVLSYLTHLAIPFLIEPSLVSAYANALTYAALSVPFICGGVVVSLALTRFPAQVSALYAADLAGAALGCIVVGPVLRLADAPTAVLATSAVSALAALLFAADARSESPIFTRGRGGRGLIRGCAVLSLVLAAAAVSHGVAARHNAAWLRLMWVKGQ
jgi:hypothetical protein